MGGNSKIGVNMPTFSASRTIKSYQFTEAELKYIVAQSEFTFGTYAFSGLALGVLIGLVALLVVSWSNIGHATKFCLFLGILIFLITTISNVIKGETSREELKGFIGKIKEESILP